MPSVLTRRSRTADSDDENLSSRAQTSSSSGPSDSKRARRELVDEEASSLAAEPPQTNGLQARARRRKSSIKQPSNGDVKPLLRQHQPGAIVRVKLRNFVTYSFVEFFPGPNLNMVIGPNGSGKSTLVCAICLGLGWGSQHLGRARDVSEFVKTGCREATIEIEIQKDHRTRRNPVITRIIKKEGNKSTYSMNGSVVSGKNVQEFARSMDIQIDNLCQFLPQDKVVEFAAMTPVELLQSTQRAAAGPEMLQFHEDLKKLRSHQRELLVNSRDDREALSNLESRQEMQREDVERLKERSDIKRKVAWMEKCRPIPKYADAKARVRAAKERKNILSAELRTLTTELAPALRRVNERQSYEIQVRKALEQGREVSDKADRTAENIMKKITDLEQKLKDLEGTTEAEKRSIKTKKEDRHRIRDVIVRIKKQMEEEPEQFDPKAANDKIAELNARRRQIADTVHELNEQLTDLQVRGQAKVNEKQSDQQRLVGLDTQAGQQEHKLQQLSRDSYQAWKWIQEHEDQFEHKVYGPPLIECSLKDPKYANAIESLFQENDFKAFTAQSRNDFYMLQRVLNREMKLQDVSLRVCSSSSADQFQPPLSDTELRSCGMEGWAIDFLNGPEVVLAMLCGEKSLHATAITLRDISQEQFNRLENSNVRSWVVNGTLFQAVRRREYGAAGNSTRTRNLRDARIWTNRPVDPAAKERLQQRIIDLDTDIAVIKEEMNRQKDRKREFASDHTAIGEEVETLKTDKERKQKALTIFKALPTKLAQEEEKLKAIEEHLSGVRERMDIIQKAKDKVLLEKAETTTKYADAVVEFRKTHDTLLELALQHIEAKSDFDTLKSRNEHVQATLKAKQDAERAAVEESTLENTKAKELIIHVKNLAAEAKDLAEAGDESWQDYLAEYGKKSADELEADIESEKARLELTHEGNSNILKEFEDRQKRIDRLRDGLQKFLAQKEEVRTAIEEIRGEWEPKLDALVAKISDAFSDSFARIGCAGQVIVFKASSSDREGDDSRDHLDRSRTNDETQVDGNGNGLDFANWAIHISVKFRDSEPLSLLDSHRQSGGERAVSTIFYLMALQSLSRAPFRVVDEINQGMDPRNERMVHGRMVDIACGEGEGGGNCGSQYFLITPKLLSGLKYKRGMRVLNIVSGEKMPAYGSSDGQKVDFDAWVRRARELGLGKIIGGISRGPIGADVGAASVNGERGRVDSGMHFARTTDSLDGGEDGLDGDGEATSVRSQSRVAEVCA